MKTMLLKSIAFASLSLVAAQNCNLVVPTAPLTATGLATPWKLSTTTGSPAPCSSTSFGGSVYVEATIFDTKTNTFSAYFPLVVNDPANAEASPANTAATGAAATGVGVNGYPGGAAVAPVVPVLTATSIVGIWIGGNNGNTILVATGTGAASSLVTGVCVNGLSAADVFGEYAYCNAVAFWTAVNAALAKKLIALPAQGVTVKGVPCPTVRSFTIVDQDQSDNVVTNQLLVETITVNAATGLTTATTGLQVAQDTVTNRNNLNVVSFQVNASDNLLCKVVQQYVGCNNIIWVVNLAEVVNGVNGGPLVTTQALQEVVALSQPDANIALVPAIDPMTLSNGAQSLTKLNAYRAGVNQTPATALNPTDNVNYCNNLVAATPMFLAQHAEVLMAAPSLVPSVGSNMLNLLCARYIATVANLNCLTLNPNLQQLVTVTTNRDNVAIANNLLTLFPQFTTTTKITVLPTAAPSGGAAGGPGDAAAGGAGAGAAGGPGDAAAGGAGAGAAGGPGDAAAQNTAAGAPISIGFVAGVAGAAVGAIVLLFVALFAFGVITFRKATPTTRV